MSTNRGLVKLKLCLDHGILYLQKEWEAHLCTNIKWSLRYTGWGKKDNKGQYMVGKIWEKQYTLFANICKKHSWKDTWKAGNTGYGKGTEPGELRWEMLLFSCVRLFVTPWTAAHQASLSFTIYEDVSGISKAMMRQHGLEPVSKSSQSRELRRKSIKKAKMTIFKQEMSKVVWIDLKSKAQKNTLTLLACNSVL